MRDCEESPASLALKNAKYTPKRLESADLRLIGVLRLAAWLSKRGAAPRRSIFSRVQRSAKQVEMGGLDSEHPANRQVSAPGDSTEVSTG
jgi:hypothetical protein